jgi:hypothetical protein
VSACLIAQVSAGVREFPDIVDSPVRVVRRGDIFNEMISQGIPPHHAAQLADGGAAFYDFAQLLQVDIQTLEDAHGHAFPFADDAEQQVFHSDVVVPQTERFFPAVRDHVLYAGREFCIHGLKSSPKLRTRSCKVSATPSLYPQRVVTIC